MITPEDQNQFRDRGYIIIHNALDSECIYHLTEVVSHLINEALQGRLKMKFADREKGIPTGRLTQLLEPKRSHPTIGNWLQTDIAPRIRKLLNVDITCTDLGILFAGAGQSVKLGWHRDAGGTSMKPDEYHALEQDAERSCSFQAPLKPGDNFHELVPGTHKRLLTPDEAEARIDPKCGMPGAIRIHLEPGDILFRHTKILHRGTNPEGKERWTFVGDYWCK